MEICSDQAANEAKPLPFGLSLSVALFFKDVALRTRSVKSDSYSGGTACRYRVLTIYVASEFVTAHERRVIYKTSQLVAA